MDPGVFNLPAEPFGLTVAADGSIWFTCWSDRCIGRFDPATETFERFAPNPPGELPSVPVDILFSSQGDVLFTMKMNPGAGGIVRYEPDIYVSHFRPVTDFCRVFMAGIRAVWHRPPEAVP